MSNYNKLIEEVVEICLEKLNKKCNDSKVVDDEIVDLVETIMINYRKVLERVKDEDNTLYLDDEKYTVIDLVPLYFDNDDIQMYYLCVDKNGVKHYLNRCLFDDIPKKLEYYYSICLCSGGVYLAYKNDNSSPCDELNRKNFNYFETKHEAEVFINKLQRYKGGKYEN